MIEIKLSDNKILVPLFEQPMIRESGSSKSEVNQELHRGSTRAKIGFLFLLLC
jgi:hypothetical protein